MHGMIASIHAVCTSVIVIQALACVGATSATAREGHQGRVPLSTQHTHSKRASPSTQSSVYRPVGITGLSCAASCAPGAVRLPQNLNLGTSPDTTLPALHICLSFSHGTSYVARLVVPASLRTGCPSGTEPAPGCGGRLCLAYDSNASAALSALSVVLAPHSELATMACPTGALRVAGNVGVRQSSIAAGLCVGPPRGTWDAILPHGVRVLQDTSWLQQGVPAGILALPPFVSMHVLGQGSWDYCITSPTGNELETADRWKARGLRLSPWPCSSPKPGKAQQLQLLPLQDGLYLMRQASTLLCLSALNGERTLAYQERCQRQAQWQHWRLRAVQPAGAATLALSSSPGAAAFQVVAVYGSLCLDMWEEPADYDYDEWGDTDMRSITGLVLASCSAAEASQQFGLRLATSTRAVHSPMLTAVPQPGLPEPYSASRPGQLPPAPAHSLAPRASQEARMQLLPVGPSQANPLPTHPMAPRKRAGNGTLAKNSRALSPIPRSPMRATQSAQGKPSKPAAVQG